MDGRVLWNRLRWELGSGGLAAAAVLLGAVLYASIAVPTTHSAIEAQRAELDASMRQARSPSARADSPQSTARRLQDFYAQLPRERTAVGWLGKFQSAATLSGLRLKSGEYRLERRPDQRVMQYRITLPVSGNYGQIRAFIGQVLDDIPYASLDEVRLTRESTQARKVEARLKFSLFLLAEAP